QVALDHGVMHLAAGQHIGKGVAYELADAQLALGGAGGCLLSTMARHVHEPKASLRCPVLRRATSFARWKKQDVDGRDKSSAMTWLERPLHRLDAVALDDVADLHVLVVLEGHAAFLAGGHLARVVLEALELRKLALVHHHVVANEPHVGATLDHAVG